ncbi:uncharacterized protein LOC143228071 isoform X1 [Tachypleus tridentatus]|uniref:uncharacterized protein LOC143228071 isoform X1 n=1 Tax=Tachypleus tridentatus TaxID=6853 RepID=UPI003FD4A9A2
MAHQEQFQRLAEDMRRHWEVEKSELQKFHAEEIEDLKTKWSVEKSRLEEVHQDEINHLKKCFQQQLEEIQHTMQQNQQEELKILEKTSKQKVDSLQVLLRNIESDTSESSVRLEGRQLVITTHRQLLRYSFANE